MGRPLLCSGKPLFQTFCAIKSCDQERIISSLRCAGTQDSSPSKSLVRVFEARVGDDGSLLPDVRVHVVRMRRQRTWSVSVARAIVVWLVYPVSLSWKMAKSERERRVEHRRVDLQPILGASERVAIPDTLRLQATDWERNHGNRSFVRQREGLGSLALLAEPSWTSWHTAAGQGMEISNPRSRTEEIPHGECA